MRLHLTYLDSSNNSFLNFSCSSAENFCWGGSRAARTAARSFSRASALFNVWDLGENSNNKNCFYSNAECSYEPETKRQRRLQIWTRILYIHYIIHFLNFCYLVLSDLKTSHPSLVSWELNFSWVQGCILCKILWSLGEMAAWKVQEKKF